MVYASFTVWLFLMLFMGMGIFRLWSGLVRPASVSWALLPGTVVSEMAYIFGCLITGGEIRRAKLIPGGGKGGDGGSEPTTEATSALRVIGPLVAALVSIVACAGAVLFVHAFLGEPVMDRFAATLPAARLPNRLPADLTGFWDQLEAQVSVLRRMFETWRNLEWTNWRVPLFVYLAACLSIRLAPVRRDPRATLGAVVVIAGVIAIIGALSPRFENLMSDVWPLLTYVWANLLFLLVASLVIRGIVALVRILSGKKGKV
jgi:hypothetical protein